MKAEYTQLLAPAGSFDAFLAALAGGADAVYLAGSGFNARANAKNFTDDELKEAFRLSRLYEKKIYITLNTLVFDRDFDAAVEAAGRYMQYGADTFIIQDLGLAAELKARCPEVKLHASTQMTGTSVEAAELLHRLGYERMVAPRELDRAGLIELCERSPIETEYFVHGALCVCYSGQCLFSSVVGRRSGNFGLCAQPCRMEYSARGKTGYLLSLKDNCLADELGELKRAGVACLKIEGRMKSPEYVYGITRQYRTLLDKDRAPTDGERDFLERLFARDGFTSAYFRRGAGPSMFGARTEKNKRDTAHTEKALAAEKKEIKRIPCEMRFFADRSAVRLEMSARGETASAEGDRPNEAISSPMTPESAARSLCKLGQTPFELKSLDCDISANINMAPSALNLLRRTAAERLERRLTEFRPLTLVERTKSKPSCRQSGGKPELRLVFDGAAALTDSLESKLSDICSGRKTRFFVPLWSDGAREGRGILMPPVFLPREAEGISARLAELRMRGVTDAICTNIGFIPMLEKHGFNIHGSYRLNVTNKRSARLFYSLGLCSVTVSPECADGAIREMARTDGVGAFVYGRLPLMTLENCLIRNSGGCRERAAREHFCPEKLTLKDRTGTVFPVITAPGHRNVILNSLPSYRADSLKDAGTAFYTLYFTDESESEIISAVRRAADFAKPEGAYTRR